MPDEPMQAQTPTPTSSAARSIELRHRRIWLDGVPGLFLGG
jgi:hypothetical protein